MTMNEKNDRYNGGAKGDYHREEKGRRPRIDRQRPGYSANNDRRGESPRGKRAYNN